MAFGLVVVCVPLTKQLALRYGVTDKPGPGHPHSRVTAKLGGAAILAGFAISLLAVGSLPIWMGLCMGGMLALGLADDILVLIPKSKLILQFLVATAYVLTSRHFGDALWPSLVGVISLFWLVATTNAFNLIDGLDGLACGIGIIACSAILAVSIFEHNSERAVQAAALGAALLGFLPYNSHPATIFMGDGGSLPLGFLLGVLSFPVDGAANNYSIAFYVFPLLVMFVPLLDAGTVTIARISTGRTISERGLDHLHHRLLAFGLSHRGAVLFCYAIAVVSSLYAVTATVMPRMYLVLTLPMVCLALAPFALFLIDLAFEVNSPGATYGRVHGLARMILSFTYRLRLIEVLLDLFLAAASYFAVFLLWNNFHIKEQMLRPLLEGLPWVLGATCSAFYISRVYRGMWHYMGLADVVRFGNGAAVAVLLTIMLSAVNLVPFEPGAVILFGILLLDLLLVTRVSLRLIRNAIDAFATAEWRILIIGTHANWQDIVSQCSQQTGRRTKAVGFIDDDLFTHGMMAGGVRVLGPMDAIERIYSSTRFDEVVITERKLDQDQLLILRRFAHQHQVRLCNYSVQLEELVDESAPERLAGNGAVQLAGANVLP
jgi:UDP-GlcNAc:undecaprenyl-phosphate/decaprenyl-phosphate GlcNAc-1-phosphate transferase